MKTFKEFINETDGWKKTATLSYDDAVKRFPEHAKDFGLLNNRDMVITKHEAGGKRHIIKIAGKYQVHDHFPKDAK